MRCLYKYFRAILVQLMQFNIKNKILNKAFVLYRAIKIIRKALLTKVCAVK